MNCNKGVLAMEEEFERIVKMKNIYETQVRNLKEDWKKGRSKFCKIKDYKIQLNIWEKRIAHYETELNNLSKKQQ
jgi:predicted  nucleic acid-binding Zn-ribbon protein